MSKGHRIEVLATDGAKSVRLLWFTREKDDLYWGPLIQGLDSHGSYHASGVRHFTYRSDKGKKVGTGEWHWPRLDEFAGIAQLTGSTSRKDLTHIPWVPYKGKRVDEAIWIDTRGIASDWMFINVLLLEPKRFDLLKGLGGAYPGSYLHISISIKPWLVVEVGPG
ncbi:MAG: hypothetical protein ACE5KH_04415 [Candidatus Geothermarchaeales archaeon]